MEFVAVAEGTDLPLYIFTYNIEMAQFSYTDTMKSVDQEECLDKTILSHHHSQFVSHQIADEARLNNHKLEMTDEDFSRLMRHHQVVTVEYAHDVTGADNARPLPMGLEKHDVYLVKQKVSEQAITATLEEIEDQILLNIGH